LPLSAELVGTLCSRGAALPQTVQVLVHGGTYDQRYWDWPVANERYSYVNAATAAGYATFAFDRLGTGHSTKPPSAQVDLTANIATIHQVIQALRRGTIGGQPFRHVVYVGHSIGAQLAWAEVATYQDVDAVIISATDHVPSVAGTTRVIDNSYPATQDPQFATAPLDEGYLTSKPGTRGASFYNVSHADPRIIAEDERLKGTYTLGEVRTVLPLKRTEVSQGITVPVLLAMGERDNIHCQADTIVCTPRNLYDQEHPYYAAPACLSVLVVHDMGHDMNLDLSAPQWFRAAPQWIDRLVGVGEAHQPRSPCALPLTERLQMMGGGAQ
jgi:pimeloyl-ACP methyl ester carboxylesterase